MHRDTIVGIVGAVALVAVMVAVFAYEYNQAGTVVGEPPGTTPFAEQYPLLSASDDIDGDGLANSEDDDLDGRGGNNSVDVTVDPQFPFSGQIAQGEGLPVASGFFAGNGTVHVMAWVNYTLPAPAPVGSAFSLSVRLLDATGTVVAQGRADPVAPGENGAHIVLETPDVTPGLYTIEVSRANPGTATAFEGAVVVHYDPGTPEEDTPIEKR